MSIIKDTLQTHGNYTVSSATLRAEDLVPSFLEAIEDLDPARAEIIMAQYAEDVRDPENADPFFVNEVLFYNLEALAPEGYYFGTLEGDGSEFGFWPIEEGDT